ncbi:SDR family oxidoreductase [Bradyrhizobium sp. IC3069]|nr:SDR family oxidoreductase [Bradyrhizobium sp. IC4059]MCA1518426.1 SDR family oxidoreductase [Bradyrhizobium sp. IC3069]
MELDKLDGKRQEQESHARGSSPEGRVALGAAGGLGKAIATELRERGADVHGVDIVSEGVFHADLSTASGNRDVVAYVLATAPDILVLNPGCQFIATLDQFPDAEWNCLRSVMLDGPFFALKAAWPALTKSSGACVVVTASPVSYGGRARRLRTVPRSGPR